MGKDMLWSGLEDMWFLGLLNEKYFKVKDKSEVRISFFKFRP